MMKDRYRIYISDHCSDCDKLVRYVEEKGFEVEVLNIDRCDKMADIKIYIIPALMAGEKLLAYGENDIIRILERA